MNQNTITNIGDTIDKSIAKTAIIDLSKSPTVRISYSELDSLSNAVARGLKNNNILPGNKVAILAANSIEYIATLLGILRCGAIAVPINNKLADTQINQILIDSESKILFSNRVVECNLVTIDFNNDFITFCDHGDFEVYQPSKDDTAFLLYTSGSYSTPKGVIITHSGHSWFLQKHKDTQKQWGSKKISLICSPLYHANGLTTLEGSICTAATIVLMPQFNPTQCIQAIQDYKVNCFYAVPTMLAMIVQEKEMLEKTNVSSLRLISMASSPLNKNLIENLRGIFPNATIYNNYGITEVGPSLFGLHPTLMNKPSASVGYPRQGIDYRIIDGILQIKSPSMMSAYYKQTLPGSITSDGFFITNDLFEIDNAGFYYFIGRADDVFKCGGNKVIPEEVEKILDSHPAVATSAVIGLDDDIKGKKPYAFVVLNKGTQLSEKELINYSLINGPAYQHPRKVWFLDLLPFAATNKIDKRKLEELARNLLEKI